MMRLFVNSNCSITTLVFFPFSAVTWGLSDLEGKRELKEPRFLQSQRGLTPGLSFLSLIPISDLKHTTVSRLLAVDSLLG